LFTNKDSVSNSICHLAANDFANLFVQIFFIGSNKWIGQIPSFEEDDLASDKQTKAVRRAKTGRFYRMSKQSDINAELKEVAAYPTKQKMHQQNVELLEQGGCCCSSTNENVKDEHQQG
jgi:hypothetical protein